MRIIHLEAGPWRWWYALLGFGLTLCSPILALWLVQPSRTSQQSVTALPQEQWTLILQFVFFVLLGLLLLLGLRRRALAPTELGLTLALPRRIVLTTVGGFLLITAFAWLSAKLSAGDAAADRQILNTLRLGASFSHDLSAILVVAIGAPIAEEFLYRGLIFRGLYDGIQQFAPRFRFLTAGVACLIATIISSQLFASAHSGGDEDGQRLVLFGLGAIACLAYALTGSLYAPILIHSLNNAYGLFMLLRTSGITLSAPWLLGLLAATPLLTLGLVYLLQLIMTAWYRAPAPTNPPAAGQAALSA